MAGNSGMGSRGRAGLVFNSPVSPHYQEPTLLLPTLVDQQTTHPFGHTAMLGELGVPLQLAHLVGVGDETEWLRPPHIEHPH